MSLFVTTFFDALWGMAGAFALAGAASLLAGLLAVGLLSLMLPTGTGASPRWTSAGTSSVKSQKESAEFRQMDPRGLRHETATRSR